MAGCDMSGADIRVLVLGATGMLGNAVLRYFDARGEYAVTGSVRSGYARTLLPEGLRKSVVVAGDVDQPDSLVQLVAESKPSVVINCVGLIKQLAEANDPLHALPVNSLLPHRLARICALAGARLVHISTDCVFSGNRGMYTESDVCDARDLYGLSKYLGEVSYPHTVTLRTSIIGHELSGNHGLIGWFLAQHGAVKGFRRAVFSGLPAVELATVIHNYVVPNAGLSGLYHVSVDPIDKYSLLMEVRNAYRSGVEVVPDDAVVVDRSLDSQRFRTATGYRPPRWSDLIGRMRDFG